MANQRRIANVSRFGADWRWIADKLTDQDSRWSFFCSQHRNIFERRMPLFDAGRMRAAWAARRSDPDIVISHGPWETLYCAIALSGKSQVRHIAMSFNFTDLPTGKLLIAMRRFFRSVDQFIIFSKMEQALYAGLFDIPADRFRFVHWSARPPIDQPLPRALNRPYFAALGGEGRDYATLAEVARLRPQDQFLFIARPWSFDGIALPDNVEVRINLPLVEAWSHVYHATASLLPLRSNQTPNGHVTLVGSMLLGKTNIVTGSAGVSDYVADGDTALLVPSQSPAAFADAIQLISDNPDKCEAIGLRAKRFAETHCSEQNMVDFVDQLLVD